MIGSFYHNSLLVPAVFGIVTACVPSFGVAANKVDQVDPPLVEIKMSTLAQLTPFAVVRLQPKLPFVYFPPKISSVWRTNQNGPAVALTVIMVSSHYLLVRLLCYHEQSV
jgi:hypothetical protein